VSYTALQGTCLENKRPASTLKCQATKEMAFSDFAVPIGGSELEWSGFASVLAYVSVI
jgi:hypothetical protein